MSGRPRRFGFFPYPARAIVLGLIVAGGAATCAEETAPTVDVGPVGTVFLNIKSPLSGQCIVVPAGADPTVPIEVDVRDPENGNATFILRPPGNCGTYGHCGRVALEVNGVENNEGATSVVDLLLRKLADRYTNLTVKATLVNDEGVPFANTDGGEPVSATVTFKSAKPCAEGESGACGCGGAAPDAGVDAGDDPVGDAGDDAAGDAGDDAATDDAAADARDDAAADARDDAAMDDDAAAADGG